MGKGSGSVTTFSGADGFITIDQHTEILDAGSDGLGPAPWQQLEPADLVIIGSHCVGLDLLIGKLMRQGIRTKSLYVGSMGGLAAAKRGECDVAGVHLLDPATGEYNRPMLTDRIVAGAGLRPHAGYRVSAGDARFKGKHLTRRWRRLQGPECVMVNRNAGSGTRIIIDKLLGAHRPPAMACKPSPTTRLPRPCRKDAPTGAWRSTRWRGSTTWDSFRQEEQYDFIVPTARLKRPAVRAFCELLDDQQARRIAWARLSHDIDGCVSGTPVKQARPPDSGLAFGALVVQLQTAVV